VIILFFGQPASGKTTLAEHYIKLCIEPSNAPFHIHIDGDRWRTITNNVNYTKEGRMSNLKSAFDMAIYLEQEGFTPILSFVTPYDEFRQYLHDKSSCLKQIYLKYTGERGRTDYFAKDFEEATGEYLLLDTSSYSIDYCLTKIKEYVEENSAC
jgi:adenylylsulfate kinase-like enzyme